MNIYSLDDPLEFDFAENNGEIEITGYHGGLDYLSIPSELDGKTVAAVSGLGGCLIGAYFPGSVREISPKALRDISCAEISSENPYFRIENNILYSGDMRTLFYCFDKNIRSFKLPGSVETIGAYAFYECEALELKKDLFPDGLRVISKRAFCGCEKLLLHGKKKKARLPKSLEEIGLEAFALKKSARSLGEGAALYSESRIVFPETVKKITCYTKYFGQLDLDRSLYFRAENGVVITADGKTAIGYCGEISACSVVIPDSVEVIDEYAFFCLTNLRSVFLGNKLCEIRKSAFEFCRLSSLHIPEKLEFLGENALPLQTLDRVTADENNRFFRTDGSCLYYKNELLVCFNGLIEEYFVPDETEVIHDGAFENCRLLSNLVLPKNLRRFSGMILPGCNNREAFRNLLETDIPEDIEDFSDESVNPASLRFSDSAKTVFRHGGIVYKRVNEGLAAIYAFNDTISKTVLDGTVVIAENAFAGCDILTSVDLPETLRRIEAGAFSFCGLQTLELPDGVEYIGENAFEYCPLGRVFIPRNVKLISSAAFGYGTEYFEVSPENPRYSSENGALYSKDKTVLLRVPVSFPRRKFTVPEGVIEIRGAFKFCERITKIVLPKSLEIIRSGTFHSMKNTPAVIFRNSTAQILEDFAKQPNECVLVAECGSSTENFFRKYKKTTALNDIPCRIKFRTAGSRPLYKQVCDIEVLFGSDGTAEVSGSCGTAESITIPEKAGGHAVTGITEYAFAGNEHLRSVSIPDTVKKIGEGAFYRCQRLTVVRLPAQSEEVSKRMFGGCTGLRRCIIPEGCKSIRANAFQACYNLSVLGIPRSVEHISRRIFGKRMLSPLVYVERGSYAEKFFKKYKHPPRIISVNSMSDIPNAEIHDLSDSFVCETRPDGSARVYSGNVSIMTDREEFTVPEEVNGYTVTEFSMCNIPPSIKRVYIPACVEEIELAETAEAAGIFVDPENKHYFSDGQAVYTKDKTVLLQFFDHSAERYTVSPKTRRIAKRAFCGFERLTEVVLPDGLEKIGYMAFAECPSICEMNIPDSVRRIGAYAFEMGYSNKLGKINIPESLEVIKCGAFGLEGGQLFIPKNVRRIEPDELTVSSEFIVSEDNPYFSSMDGCLYNKNKTELIKYYDDPARNEFAVPETVTVIGKCAFAFTNFVRRVILGKNVKRIKNRAFYWANTLTYIDLENVERIGWSAFSHSGIISADIRCKKISMGAFGSCHSLTDVTLIGTEKIGIDAFEQCSSLRSAALPETLRAIGHRAFSRCCKLENLTIPKSVVKIGRDAFFNIASFEFYDSLKLSPAKFLCDDTDFCRGTSRITVRSAQTDDILFELPAISKDECCDLFYSIINCWGSCGRFDFYELDNNFPAESGFSDTLARIAVYRLLYQRGLLPPQRDMYLDWLLRYATETVCCFIKLGDLDTFSILEQMGLIEYGEREKILDSALASGKPEITARLLEYFEKIPCAADLPELPDLDDAPPWKASSATPTKAGCYPFSAPDAVFPEEINGVRITGVAARGSDIPENYPAITSLTIPEGYTSIGENAFYGCKNLRSVSLPSTLKIIGDLAFGQCEKLEEIIIPDGVLSIGNGAFLSCPRLEKVRFPISLRQIGEDAFDKLSPDSVPEELKWLFETEEYGF